MSSSEKERKFAFLEEERKKDERQMLENKAWGQLADEGKMGFCGTDEDIREQGRLISARATEIGERAQFEELRKKYG